MSAKGQNPPRNHFAIRFLSITLLLLNATSLQAQPELEDAQFEDLLGLSIEELLNVDVRTVSRRPEPLSRAPAAIHVITQEHIRRSGATTLPDILRLAPGVQVAQVHAHQWGVSARGFNDVFSNKLLVMIDGRSIYSPLFSGVFWDSRHTLLEDIEQIEVIRGPGASLWGANAVNGVINIITKSARDTQGTLVSGTTGTIENFIGSIRHGWQIQEDHFFRVYLQHRDHDNFPSARNGDANDSWNFTQGGFRSDKDLSDISVLTLQGDLYRGDFDESYTRVSEAPPHDPFQDQGRVHARGGNILGRISRSLESDADATLQVYYDASRRETEIINEDRHTFDLDLQHRLPMKDAYRQTITWGAGYRISADEIGNTFDVSLDPDSRTLQLFSFFVQDEIELMPDSLVLTLGSKLEHNDFTGFEVQPGGRLSWTPRQRQTIWGSIARAVRTPSRSEHDIRLNQPTEGQPIVTSIFGSPRFKSEELIAYEIGYRVQPHDVLSFDLAGFYNDYDRVRSLEPGAPRADPAPAHVPVFASNEVSGETYGFELAANWRASDAWKLHGSYSLLRLHLRQSRGSTDPQTVAFIEGSSPKHQWLVRSSLDLPGNWEWDTWFRFVDQLPAREVDSYLEMDMRLSWLPLPGLEFSLVGRNLLQNQHREFSPSPLVQNQQAEVPRSVYGKITWSF